jgi:hypothetical protein
MQRPAINKTLDLTIVFFAVIAGLFVFDRFLRKEKQSIEYVQAPNDTVFVVTVKEHFVTKEQLKPVFTFKTDTTITCDDSLRVYEQRFDDSLTTTFVRDTVRGELLSRMLVTTTKERIIERVDTVKTTVTLDNFSRWNAFAFLNANDKNDQPIGGGFGVLYNTKRRASFLLQRDVVNNRTSIGFGVNF